MIEKQCEKSNEKKLYKWFDDNDAFKNTSIIIINAWIHKLKIYLVFQKIFDKIQLDKLIFKNTK